MRTIIAANWKMYKTRAEAKNYIGELQQLIGTNLKKDREVLVFSPFTALSDISAIVSGTSWLNLGAQNVYPAEEGAFTGEISPRMLQDCGVQWVLAGHSERRHVFGESEKLVGEKVHCCLEKDFSVMLCIGETLEEREAGKLETVLRSQLETLRQEKSLPMERLALAYEPVWAIGTGKVASNDDIVEAHALVRRLLADISSVDADTMPILYGGSVKPENATQILTLDNVNGVLVGGASLQADSFTNIALA